MPWWLFQMFCVPTENIQRQYLSYWFSPSPQKKPNHTPVNSNLAQYSTFLKKTLPSMQTPSPLELQNELVHSIVFGSLSVSRKLTPISRLTKCVDLHRFAMSHMVGREDKRMNNRTLHSQS